MRPTVAELARVLGLEPHPEGGLFRETYRAVDTVGTPRGRRPACTAILFLVPGEAISRLHRLTSDELWVFQGGLPLELVLLTSEGELRRGVLGDPGDPDGGETGESLVPQVLAPAGCWQGARLAGGLHLPADRAWSLASCVVTPGFAFEDFELGEREALLAAYPEHDDLIRAFT